MVKYFLLTEYSVFLFYFLVGHFGRLLFLTSGFLDLKNWSKAIIYDKLYAFIILFTSFDKKDKNYATLNTFCLDSKKYY